LCFEIYSVNGSYHRSFTCAFTNHYKQGFKDLRSRKFNRALLNSNILSRAQANSLIGGLRNNKTITIKCVDSQSANLSLFGNECKTRQGIHTFAFVHQNTKEMYICENNIVTYNKKNYCFIFGMLVHESYHYIVPSANHNLVYEVGEFAEQYCLDNL
jgi:hypothetical protein